MKTTINRKLAHDIYGWINDKNIVKFDKETRKAVIGICRALKPVATAYDEDRKTAQEKVFAGQTEALEKRSEAYRRFHETTDLAEKKKQADIIKSYVELIPLDKEFAEIIADMDKEEVEVDIPQMDEDRFIDGCGESDIPVSMAILDDLAPFFKEDKE